MNEIITELKARLQGLFEKFNSQGSWTEMNEDKHEALGFGLIDSYTVTRVAPHFDAAGNITSTDFWLLFKSAGYNNGWQYAHTIKVIAWHQDDTYMLDVTDDRSRRYHIELLCPNQDLALLADWKNWQKYKAANAILFEQIDAQLLEEHIAMAEGWQ